MNTLVRVLAALALLTASTASAQSVAPGDADPPTPEEQREAHALFELAHAHYDAGRYAEAAGEFERAFALTHHPELLYNLHLAYRDAGDVPRAVDALRRFLASSATIEATLRRTLERRLEAMEASLAAHSGGAVEPTTTEPADATPHPDPDPDPGSTPDPDHVDALASPDLDATRVGGPPEGARAHDDGPVIGEVVSFTVAGTAAIVAAVTGGSALAERDRLASSCAPACTEAQVSTARDLGYASDTSLAFAAAGAIAGIVLVVIDATSGDGPVVVPSVSPEHAAIVIGGRL